MWVVLDTTGCTEVTNHTQIDLSYLSPWSSPNDVFMTQSLLKSQTSVTYREEAEEEQGAESLPTPTSGLGPQLLQVLIFKVMSASWTKIEIPSYRRPMKNRTYWFAMVRNSFCVNACTAILRLLQVVFVFWSPSCVSWKLHIQFLTLRLHVCITTERWHNFTRSMINCLVQLTSWQCWHGQFFTWGALEIAVLHWFNDITALYPRRPKPTHQIWHRHFAILINIKHDDCGRGIVSSR